MKTSRFFALFFLIGICIQSHNPVLSSGGLISGDDRGIHLNRLHALFNVDDQAGTITAIYYVQEYVGSAQRFVWLIPVPDSQPKVDLIRRFYVPLDDEASPEIRAPDPYCTGIYFGYYGRGLVGDGGGSTSDRITPDSYSVISGENVLAWLRQNDYSTTDETVTILSDYIIHGMSFVAFSLQQAEDSTSGTIATIMITYHADTLSIPLRLVAANVSTDAFPDKQSYYRLRDRFPISVSIIGDTFYHPTNYENLEVDFHDLRNLSAVSYPVSTYPVPGFPVGRTVFYEEAYKLLHNSSGQAFVKVYAGTTDKFLQNWRYDEYNDAMSEQIKQSLAESKYITRFYGLIPLDKLTTDPAFEPSPDSFEMLEQVDLKDYVDPLAFWGCSSRNLEESTPLYHPDRFAADQFVPYASIKDSLPAGSTFMGDAGFSARYPAGWVESKFTLNDFAVHVFAPQVVNVDVLTSFSKEKNAFPMFLVAPLRLVNCLRIPFEWTVTQNPNSNTNSNCREFTPPFTDSTPFTLILLTSDEDWQTNEKLYTAMLDFPFTYQYFLSDKLRYTLFLDDSASLEIPYPEGWSDRVLQPGVITIAPDDSFTSSASIQIQRISTITNQGDLGYPGWVQSVVSWLGQQYGIDAHTVYDTVVNVPESLCTANFGTPMPFVGDEQGGFILLTNYWIVVVSSSKPDFTENEVLLHEIAASINLEHVCG